MSNRGSSGPVTRAVLSTNLTSETLYLFAPFSLANGTAILAPKSCASQSLDGGFSSAACAGPAVKSRDRKPPNPPPPPRPRGGGPVPPEEAVAEMAEARALYCPVQCSSGLLLPRAVPQWRWRPPTADGDGDGDGAVLSQAEVRGARMAEGDGEGAGAGALRCFSPLPPPSTVVTKVFDGCLELTHAGMTSSCHSRRRRRGRRRSTAAREEEEGIGGDRWGEIVGKEIVGKEIDGGRSTGRRST